MRKVFCILMISAFSLVLAVFFALNIKGVLSQVIATRGQSMSERTTQIETFLTDNIRGKGAITEVYGATHNALSLDVIGSFEYVRDDAGIMQRIESEIDYAPFIRYMKTLSDVLKKGDIELLVVQYPDRGEHFAFRDALGYFGKTSSEMTQELESYGIDVLDIEDAVSPENSAVLDHYFLNADIHLTTEAEYLNAKLITDYLAKCDSISFPMTDTVYDAQNWDWSSHDFWGNFGRSSGKTFSGTDTFTSFLPKFDTKMRLTIPAQNSVKEGSFAEVMSNGYETLDSESPYWITNYGQWPQAAYSYENLLLPDGPRLLVLCDSLGMRANTFLSMNASSLTVLDPRYFNGEPYLVEYLMQNSYDAVIILGNCYSSNIWACHERELEHLFRLYA